METYRSVDGGWQSLLDGHIVSLSSGAGLVDGTSPSGVQPVGQTGFSLIFSDEFSGTSLDTTKWQPYYPDTTFWNKTTPGGHLTNTDEPEAYDISGISVQDSQLTLTIRDESTVAGLPYTSGMVSSYGSFNPIYGYAEARMQLCTVSGMWPAFWMDPTNQTWPPEIDIMEQWGTANSISSTYWSTSGISAGPQATSVTNVEDWHTYGVHWEAGRLRFYVDGTLTLDYQNANVSSQQMYLICNLAGDKDNPPIAASLPQSINVDYIRFWQ